MREVFLYKKIGEKVKCLNCAHYCIILNKKRGICKVRENINGKLYALNYGKVVALNIDPIEKKPFFHFLPGTLSLSLATVGCNFQCVNCQNWTISQAPRIFGKIEGKEMRPEKIVKMTLENNLPSISYTYTEPTIFSEFALDIMKLAKKENLKNSWVTNGFLSKELLDLISPYLDAVNVDLKSFEDEFYIKYCKGRLKPVLATLKRMKKKKIWIEVTTLIIPTLNDSEKNLENIANFIKKELGEETPWHVTQFSGVISWKLQHLPTTPLEAIRKAWEIGKKVGLRYVYTGNIPGLETENTFCPKCKALVIKRIGYSIERFDKEGKCPKCEEKLNFILN